MEISLTSIKGCEENYNFDNEPTYINTVSTSERSLPAEQQNEGQQDYEVLKEIQRPLPNEGSSKQSRLQRLKTPLLKLLVVFQGFAIVALLTILVVVLYGGNKNSSDWEWGTWESWEPCSVSCGAGLQKRTRSCTNLTGGSDGKICLGEVSEYQLCRLHTCNDAKWSVWSPWQSCSVTCGTGMQRRLRSCTNPAPGLQDKQCTGDASEYQLCYEITCHEVIGGWSVWSSWYACSVTCGTGLQRRMRSCTNPAPSTQGRSCMGDTSEYQLCQLRTCNSTYVVPVGFSAVLADVSATYTLGFQQLLYSSDDSFNITTGQFTCKLAGLYYFTATVYRTSTDGEFSCYIKVNDASKIRVFANENSNNNAFPSSSGSLVMKLAAADRVYLGGCNSGTNLYKFSTSFSGFLISADPFLQP